MANHLEFTVDRTPVRLYAQEAESASSPIGAAIVLLHGAGGNLHFWTSRFGPYLRQAGIALYAPHYFDQTGTVRADFTTINDGVHVPKWLATVDETLRFVAARPGVDPQRVVLAGVSLGAFLSLAFAAQLSARPQGVTANQVRAIVEISGGLAAPYDAIATERFPPTLILHGAQDTVVPISYARNLDRRLTELNVAHRTEILENEGHWFSSAALPRLLLAVSGFLEGHLQPPGNKERAM